MGAMLRLRALGIITRMRVHDELVFHEKTEDCAQLCKTVEKEMTAGALWSEGLPLKVEVLVRQRYSKE
jgi:DNA polymerase I-like protein with 3'-5' exonuclease and polymerase domains